MIPVRFDQFCGWYHPSSSAKTVVVLCGSVGFEALALHRPLRIFADQLTGYNVNVLRFDYPGTGDAVGEDSDPKQLDAWLLSVVKAVDWVRSEISPEEIVLCGIHLGALLAVAAARSLTDIGRLVLLAPITSGYTYVRAQSMMAKLSASLPGTIVDGYLDLIGQRLHSTTVKALSALDLAQGQKTFPQEVLLVAPESPATEMVARALQTVKARVTRQDFVGYHSLMREAHLNEVPFETFKQVGLWLSEPARSNGTLKLPDSASTIALNNCVERRIEFQSNRRDCLVGIICEPLAQAPKLSLIIINTGGQPHFGSTRFAVMLSRLLASNGVCTLRFDLAGIGDSILEGDDSRPRAYHDRTPDILAAIEQMAKHGSAPLVLLGVCSGAYHAMKAGVNDSRVSGLILINKEVFDWSSSRVIYFLRQTGRLAAKRGSQLLRHTTAASPGAPLGDPVRRSWRSRISRALIELDAFPSRVFRSGFLERLLRVSASRNLQVLFLTGDQEASSLDLLNANFGRGFKRLSGILNVNVKVVEGLDHGLNSRLSYQKLAPTVENALLSIANGSRLSNEYP